MKKLIKLFFLFLYFNLSAQNLPGYLPTNGLVGWWPFSGNANDMSGNSNNGTSYGAQLTLDRFMNSNSAYNFNGSSYIQMLNSGPLSNSNRSISFWFKTNSQNIGQILGYGSQPPSGGEFNILINQICSGITTDIHNNYITYKSVVGLSNNTWRHIVCVYNSSISNNITGVSFYIDGILTTSINCQNPVNVQVNTLNSPIIVGKYQGGGVFYNGQIDDIGIWNRALTQQEITALYQGCSGSVTSSITPSGNTSFCAGSNVLLNATQGAGYSYQWLLNGMPINGATNASYTASQPGNYVVSITSGGCSYNSNTVAVIVNPIPNVQISGLPSFINYFAPPVQINSSPSGGSYTGSGITNGVFTPSVAGLGLKKINYSFTDNNGCVGLASLNTIVFDTLCSNPNGIVKILPNPISVFPNPSNNELQIKGIAMSTAIIEIYNTQGALVLRKQFQNEISINELKNGIYHFRILNDNTILYSTSIIKE